MIFCILMAKASDFEVDKVHYKVYSLSNLTVIVTYPNQSIPSGKLDPSTYQGDITIPSTVSFRGKTFKVIGIGTSTFVSSNITSIELPEGMEFIGQSAFSSIQSLKEIRLPIGIKKIGQYAFAGCKLDNFIIPNTVGEIEIGSFKMKKIRFEDGDNEIRLSSFEIVADTLYIGRPIKFIGSGKISAKSIVFEKSLTHISADFLEALSVSENLTLVVNNPEPPAITVNTRRKKIENIILKSTVYVPADAVEKYKAAEGWKEFLAIEAIP